MDKTSPTQESGGSHPEYSAERGTRSRSPGRRLQLILIALGLFLLPTAIYWNTIFHRYGFRDDYSTAREAREDPGNTVRFIATQARPIYASLLIESFKGVERVEDFRWIRLTTSLLWGVLAAGFFWVLRTQHWETASAALVAALLPLLPGSQVIVAWAVAWPHVLAMLLALGGFVTAERAFSSRGRGSQAVWGAMSIALIASTTLTYQVSTFFHVTLFAAAFASRRPKTFVHVFGRGAGHAAVMGAGVAVAMGAMTAVFALGWIEPSARVGLETDPFGKLVWFVREPLRDALALIVLDNALDTPTIHHVAVALVVFVLGTGAFLTFRRHGWQAGLVQAGALLILPPAAYAAGLLSGDRLNAYRIALPMAGVVLVLFAAALREIGGRKLVIGVLGVLLLAGGWKAHRQSFQLFAIPQAKELAIIEAAADRIRPGGDSRVFIQPARHEDAPADHRFADEFGTLSADGEWIVKEMLLLVLHGRYHGEPPTFEIVGTPPPEPPGPRDVVINMRRLRDE